MMILDPSSRSDPNPASDVAGPLRALMTAYQLWGCRNECATAELSAMFRIAPGTLLDSLRGLARDGWVRIDDERGTISLTDTGARALALMPSGFDS